MGYTALGVARSLTSLRIPVIALNSIARPIGSGSRLLRIRSAPDSRDQPAELLAYLIRLAGELGDRPVLFPTRDHDVVFIDRHRDAIERCFRTCQPAGDVLDRVMNKWRLVQAAAACGTGVPRTWLLEGPADLPQVLEQGADAFPMVIKPAYAYQWRLGDRWERAGGSKGWRVTTPAELADAYGRLSDVGGKIMVQEIVPGPTEHLHIVGGYASAGGLVRGCFAARKRLQEPPDFGTGVVVESYDCPDLQRDAIRLIGALQLGGLFEIEYKLDPRDGVRKLIEINTRHWDQHELGVPLGVNVSRLAYADLCGTTLPSARPRPVSAVWWAEPPALEVFLKRLVRRDRPAWPLWSWLARRRIGATFSLADPVCGMRCIVPAWADVLRRSAGTAWRRIAGAS